jgi:hypothetical protein
MQLTPRWEVRDYRDVERRQEAQKANAWSHVKKGLNVLGTTAFVGLTLYNMFIIGEWVSAWYAKRRAARAGHWKRNHSREWITENSVDDTPRL